MALIDGWVLRAELGVLALAVLAYLLVRRRVGRRDVPLAHTAELARLPRYRVLHRRYQLLSALLGLAVAALAISAAVLGARPADVHDVPDDTATRDVMLCLDVSSSMQDLDAAVLKQFDQLAGKLRGQRFGLTIFDNAALLKFPLTDDYSFVHAQLQLAERLVGGTSDAATAWRTGVIPTATSGSSHIGDGLASCAAGFDHPKLKRSRTIVLATDGEPGPHGVYSIPAAGSLVARDGIRVYVLSRVTPQHQDIDYDAAGYADLVAVAHETHGRLFDASSTSAVPSIARGIQAEQARALKGPTRRVRSDDPTAFSLVALLAVGVLVLAGWRVRR